MILFTADWHIKIGQKNVPKDWARKRYLDFFEQVHAIECDMHIIGGDVFDRLPSMEELELFFIFISEVKVPTLIFDGNHEATHKNKTFFTQLKKAAGAINPYVDILDEPYTAYKFSILPYCYLHQKGAIESMPDDRPLFTHVRGEIPPYVKPEVELKRFTNFPVVFAGDLHSHSNTQLNIVYPGSPMTISFHRTEVKNGYLLIDEQDGSWEWKEFYLPQLLRKTVQSETEMIASTYHHTIYELEGNMQDLASTKNSDLLDKKVVKRSTEATLLLNREMTIEEELIEYLNYILELPSDKITNIIGTFHDHLKTAAMG